MLIWTNIVSGLLKVVSWFQHRSEANRNIQIGKDQRDAETLKKVDEGNKARIKLHTDSKYMQLLANELGLGKTEDGDDGQLLSELQDRMSKTSRSSRNPISNIRQLRRVEKPLYEYSAVSLGRLETCHDELRRIANELIRTWDVTIVCGTRSIDEQQKAFDSGASKLPPGKSKHNRLPSDAIDMVPVEAVRLWAKGKDLDVKIYHEFANDVLVIAEKLEIDIRWGGDWDGDGDSSDQTFMDYGHFERK